VKKMKFLENGEIYVKKVVFKISVADNYTR